MTWLVVQKSLCSQHLKLSIWRSFWVISIDWRAAMNVAAAFKFCFVGLPFLRFHPRCMKNKIKQMMFIWRQRISVIFLLITVYNSFCPYCILDTILGKMKIPISLVTEIFIFLKSQTNCVLKNQIKVKFQFS